MDYRIEKYKKAIVKAIEYLEICRKDFFMDDSDIAHLLTILENATEEDNE